MRMSSLKNVFLVKKKEINFSEMKLRWKLVEEGYAHVLIFQQNVQFKLLANGGSIIYTMFCKWIDEIAR